MCEEESVHYLRDLCREKEMLESSDTGSTEITNKLVSQEISRVQNGGRPPGREARLLDVYNERPVRVTAKVLVPVKEHPKFNFVGKLLGPRGNSLKKLQEETMTKMAVLGKGSMRNKQNEEELRKSGDPKHNHLHEDLHVEVTAFASPAEAYARLALALTEVRKYLIPDGNDEIRQKQMKEIQVMKLLEEKHEDSGQESDISCSPTSDPSHTSPTPSPSPSPISGTSSSSSISSMGCSAAAAVVTAANSPPSLDSQRHNPHHQHHHHQQHHQHHHQHHTHHQQQQQSDPRKKNILERIRETRKPVVEERQLLKYPSSQEQQQQQLTAVTVADPAAAAAAAAAAANTNSILARILPNHLNQRLKRELEASILLGDRHQFEDQPAWKKFK